MKKWLIEKQLRQEIKKRDIEIGILRSEIDEKEFENDILKKEISSYKRIKNSTL